MLARLKLWLTLRKIQAAENYEEELRLSLAHMQHVVLPRLRTQRNHMMYPSKDHLVGNGANSQDNTDAGKRKVVT